jgi:hypothetical protein
MLRTVLAAVVFSLLCLQRTTAAGSGRAGNLAAAVLFGLPLYRRCLRIFDFHPMRRTPRAIGRAKPLLRMIFLAA